MTTGLSLLFANPVPYLPDWYGGSERGAHELCVALREKGVRVAVVGQAKPGARHDSVDEIMGYPVYRVADVPGSAAEIAASVRATVLIAQNVLAVAMAGVAASIPTLLYLRHADPTWLFARARRPPAGELRHPLLDYIANSEFVRGFYERRFDVRADVVPTFIAPDAYRVEPARQTVLFVNPVPVKGVEIALLLAETRPDIPFEFVESWPLGSADVVRLEEYCRRLGNVTLHRAMPDMRELYRRAKIVLVPSLWEEAWSRVVCEAQISGIPALASRRGGLPDSVGPAGILVDPDAGLKGWVAGLSRLWDDSAAYAAYAEAALLQSRHEERQPDRIVERFIDLATRHGARRHVATAGFDGIGLSVIVPTMGRPQQLQTLLQALRGQIAGRPDRQLIVVNDGGHDGAYARVVEANRDIVRYVVAPRNGGPAAARNLGVTHADHEFLVFIDDDCVPPDYWLDWLCSVVSENRDIDVVCGTTRPLPSPRPKRFEKLLIRGGYHPRPYLLDEEPILVTANLAVRRSAFARVAGFDETMRTTEDRNLGYRLRLDGAVFHFDPAWYVYHAMTASPWSHFRRYHRYGQGIRQEMRIEIMPSDRDGWPADQRTLGYWARRFRSHVADAREECDRHASGRVDDVLYTGLSVLTRLSLDLGYVRGADPDEPTSRAETHSFRKKRTAAGRVADRFLIFALARTGSTSLTRALDCHPAIACAHEPFWPGPTNAAIQDRADLHRRLDALAPDFNGIKHVWNAMGWPPFEQDPTLQLDLATSFGPVLILRRMNALRRIVSSEIARQTGTYQPAMDTREYRMALRWFPFRRLDVRRIEDELAAEPRAIAETRQRLDDAGIRHLDIVYEELFAAGDAEERLGRIEPIFQFLGASCADLDADAQRALVAILDPKRHKLNDADILWRIPGITEIEAQFGSDATGWLFR